MLSSLLVTVACGLTIGTAVGILAIAASGIVFREEDEIITWL